MHVPIRVSALREYTCVGKLLNLLFPNKNTLGKYTNTFENIQNVESIQHVRTNTLENIHKNDDTRI